MTIQVAVNEAILLRGTSGSARATSQLIAALRELPGTTVREVRPMEGRGRSKVRNAVRDASWDLRGAAAAAAEADVLISPCNIGRASREQRHLLVVYDVMVWQSPELFDPLFAAYARRLIPFSIRRADRVLTLSAHARDFLLHLVPSADIRVLTLPGRHGPMAPVRWTAERRTVLMVGETAPHKNHVAGIEAVGRLRASSGADVHLRIIGPPGRAEADVRRSLAVADPAGRWASRESGLSDDEVDRAYAKAWVVLQPSLDEGYGLPLVEAAQRGLPVLHSGTGAMSEVLPEASVGSTDPAAFESRLGPLLAEAEWTRAASTVFQHSPRFSWDAFRNSVGLHLRELMDLSEMHDEAL